MTTLIEYSREISPKIRELLEAKEVLKEQLEIDTEVVRIQNEIKESQQQLKGLIEDRHPNVVREIKALETDIKLALKAAAKGSDYKPAELKGYFVARAKESVEKVVSKGELFVQLESELA